jgi:hypothetical protein
MVTSKIITSKRTSRMYSICCTLPKPDYTDLHPEQKKRFGFLVHELRKKGYTHKRET